MVVYFPLDGVNRILSGSCKTFFDGRVERVDRVDLDTEMFQLAHDAA